MKQYILYLNLPDSYCQIFLPTENNRKYELELSAQLPVPPCKLELELLWSLALQQGAIGVNVAHSGTVLGVLWKGDVAAETIAILQARVQQELPQLSFLGNWPLVSGGSWYRCGKEGEVHDWIRCF